MRASHLEHLILAATLVTAAIANAGAQRGPPAPASASISIPPVVAIQSIGSPLVLSRKWNAIEVAEDLVLASNADAELYVCSAGNPAPLQNAGVSVLVNATQGAFAPVPLGPRQGVPVAPVARGAQQHVRVVFRFESTTRLRAEDACLTVAYRAAPRGEALLFTQALAETRIFALP